MIGTVIQPKTFEVNFPDYNFYQKQDLTRVRLLTGDSLKIGLQEKKISGCKKVLFLRSKFFLRYDQTFLRLFRMS